ncbi:WD40-repeat-containing domain protein [Earliella scabrosa]|nr:WD40-repeat-containing domain protein [Earliella scabrosa]
MPRKYQRSLTLSNEHTKGVSVVSFSHDGSFIATGGLDGKICWWRTEDGELLYVWTGDSAVLSLVWVPRRLDTLLCGLQDGNLVVVRDTLSVFGFGAHRYPIECLAIDGDEVATGAHKELKVWNWDANFKAHQFDLLHNLPEPTNGSHSQHKEVLVTSLHWTHRRRRLLVVTYMHHGIHLFDSSSGDRLKTISLPGLIASASLSPDDVHIAISNVYHGFDVYKLHTEEPFVSFRHAGEPSVPASALPVLFVHAGHALIGGSAIGNIGLWDLYMGEMHSLVLPSMSILFSRSTHRTHSL